MKFIQPSSLALLSLLSLASAAPGAVECGQENAFLSEADTGSFCCQVLKRVLDSKVNLPNTPGYNAAVGSYYTQQNQEIAPACVVSATSASDVSQAIKLLSANCICKFAVRSGGHNPWGGAATIANGVNIDLSALNEVTVHPNSKTVQIGPGNRWLNVYQKLDAMGLSVLGGRVASVGAGGLITGGGMSFYSGRYGLVCDTVVEFEIVLASGEIARASASNNTDLFKALKGGSNNFGVVTRIKLETFEQGNLWGGTVIYPFSTLSAQLAAFVDFAGQTTYDVYGALINSYAWSAAGGGWIIANNYEYTKPVADPPVFAGFKAIQPEYVNTMRITSMSELAKELEATNNYDSRQMFYSATYVNDLDTLTELFNQANAEVQAISGVEGLTYALSLQPLPTAITKVGDLRGGNSLGLHASDGNLVLALLTASWTNAADDAAVEAAVTNMYTGANAYAKTKGTYHPFQYLNYAFKTQTPIQNYGADNVAALKAASTKYDPKAVFQKQVPGGWKL